MSEGRSSLAVVADQLARALAPLGHAFRDEQAFRQLLARLGWTVDLLPPAYLAIADKAEAALDAIESLADEAELAEVLAALAKIGDVYRAIDPLPAAPAGVDPSAFLAEAGRHLFDHLLLDTLKGQAPRLVAVLEAIGIIAYDYVEPGGGRPDFVRTRFDWEKIPERLSSAGAIGAEVFGWGTDQLKFARMVEIFSDLLIALDFQVAIGPVERALGDGFQALSTGSPAKPIELGLSASYFGFVLGDDYFDVGFRLLELPSEGSALPGLIVQPLVPDGIDQAIELGGGWSFAVRSGTDLAQQFGIVLRPGEIGLRYPFAAGAALPSAGFGASLMFAPEEPAHLFGQPGRTRLEVGKTAFSSELNLKAGDLELKAGIAPEAVALVLSASDLDGFLGSALGGKDLRVEFPLGLAWSNRTGLDFTAGLGFEISAYPHIGFAALRFDRVDLGLRFVAGAGEPPQLDLRVATALSGTIGPIAYVVDGLGVHLPIRFERGNAGPVDIGFGMIWPLGLGLVVDAGAVTGGGFIRFDPDRGRYVGMIDLKMFEIGVTATGILDTKDAAGNPLPSPGFSFFISLAVELPPIQLGFGFTLNGIGGLAGIHRAMNADAILSGVREGVLDSILFPDDPIANATAIISNLSTIFPVAMNRYVFGPMAVIGWGTPTLVRIELAIVLEVPQPILLVLLGKASIAIPTEEAAIIAINLDVVGILDFGRSQLAVDASLRDSRIAAFSLAGDMAMRLSWGDKPNFALSVGGLNPHFTPPAGFPTLRRITVALGMGDNPRISLEGYFAVTSNSLQFGAKAELYAERGGFSVHGWLSFDALLVFEPLWFQFDFAAGMTLNRGKSRIAGITVRGTLTGPSPFHAWGEGCISLFFFDVCVPFDATFGEARQVDLPDKDPWPLLEAAIKTLENWTAELPRDVTTAVSIRPPPPGSASLLLHPMGAAALRQKVLPFNRPLERFGEYEIVGPSRYDLADVAVGEDLDSKWTLVTEHFAPGNFEMLSETEKLSRDSFEEMDAGVSIGSDLVGIDESAIKLAQVTYETRIIDAGWKARILPAFLLPRAAQMLSILRGSKAASALTRSGRGKFARDTERVKGVTLRPEVFSAATTDTLTERGDLAAGARTRGAARLAIRTKRGSRASGDVQVVPTHELERAA